MTITKNIMKKYGSMRAHKVLTSAGFFVLFSLYQIYFFVPSFGQGLPKHIIAPQKVVTFNVKSTLTGGVDDIIVYTAHQTWLSRIYLLDWQGSVITYFEYDMYRFCDLEVVDNEVYVAEAFAPRVYKLDLLTGNLELVIDDWSLYYFYDLTFDGTYFYVTEWDLNRYDIDGNKESSTSFDEDVMGGAWDGTYFWTLNETNQIKCWDISNWPNIVEIQTRLFSPPSPSCRGLWFDGQYFWSADCLENTLGKIYRFDYNGQVLKEWNQPAFSGWSACLVRSQEQEVPALSTCALAVVVIGMSILVRAQKKKRYFFDS